MTTPVGLELVWAEAGGFTDPTDTKYQLGWIAEIPTFQNFNWVLQSLDRAKLAYAEADIYPWQEKIGYTAGARVIRGDKTFYCITPHNDFANTNPQDPLLDTTFSYWVSGTVFSSVTNAFTNLDARHGVRLDQLNAKTDKFKWEGNELTLNAVNSIIAMNSIGSTDDNLLFGNIGGKMVVVNVGNSEVADDRNIAIGSAQLSYELYHEGHRPTQAEVAGTIPVEPIDGKLYARRSGNWVVVTTTIVNDVPPQAAVGAGATWFNTIDARLYVDIFDGNTSQWVPASPPIVPELVAVGVDYDNIASGLAATNVQAAIDELVVKSSDGDDLIEVTKMEVTDLVKSLGQNWDGVNYADPLAVGTSALAKVYPDGSVVGSTSNGSYVRYPNGELLIKTGRMTVSGSYLTVNYPVTIPNPGAKGVFVNLCTRDTLNGNSPHFTNTTSNSLQIICRDSLSHAAIAVQTDIIINSSWT